MMFKAGRLSRRQLAVPAVLAIVVLAAGTFGAYKGLRSAPGDKPFNFGGAPGGGAGASQNDTVAGRQFLSVSQAGDSRITFFADLSKVALDLQHMAMDPAGALWLADVSGGQMTDRLLRYDISDGSTKSFEVPGSAGTALESAIAVDGRGHVILTEGTEVIDFDPATGAHRDYQLAPSSFHVPFISEPSAYPGIEHVSISADNHAYISRINTAAVTEIDLKSGNIREIPYPTSFGHVDRLAEAYGSIWITNPTTNVDGTQPQTGLIDLSTGAYTPVERVLTGFADKSDQGRLYAIDPNTGIVTLAGKQVSDAPFKVTPERVENQYLGLGFNDQLTVDFGRGVLWLASAGRTDILRFEIATGVVERYELPVYLSTSYACPDEKTLNGCKDPVEVRSRVGGMGAAANGDLYFLDESFRRIGVIRAATQ